MVIFVIFLSRKLLIIIWRSFRLLFVHIIALFQNLRVIWQIISLLGMFLPKRAFMLIQFILFFGTKGTVWISIALKVAACVFGLSQKIVVCVKKRILVNILIADLWEILHVVVIGGQSSLRFAFPPVFQLCFAFSFRHSPKILMVVRLLSCGFAFQLQVQLAELL